MHNNNKCIPLDKFIYKALYDQRYGFYMKKNPFGKGGDFITSPNISVLFSEMLAVWTIDFWGNMYIMEILLLNHLSLPKINMVLALFLLIYGK